MRDLRLSAGGRGCGGLATGAMIEKTHKNTRHVPVICGGLLLVCRGFAVICRSLTMFSNLIGRGIINVIRGGLPVIFRDCFPFFLVDL